MRSRSSRAFCFRRFQVDARYARRHHGVFKGRKLGQQVMKLKNKSELAVSEIRQGPLAPRKQIVVAIQDFARCRMVNRADNIQQRAFSCP